MSFSNVIFDIETDGFLDVCTKIHCLVLMDADTEEIRSYADKPGYPSINEGLTLLWQADMLIGHNIICFDIPCIEKIYPDWKWTGDIFDTLNISRLIYSNMLSVDFKFKFRSLPIGMYGRHSLASWGLRLGIMKGDYSDGWEKWSKAMQDYCVQDVVVNKAVYDKLLSKDYSKRAIALEHAFQIYIHRQETIGVPFNVTAAEQLQEELQPQMAEDKIKLKRIVGDIIEKKEFIPKRDNSTLGYLKGVPFIKEKRTPFNPNSRPQIVRFLKAKYKWNPTDFTDKGNPTVGRAVLEKLTDWPEVEPIMLYLDMAKLSGQLYTGKNAWLKLQKDGRIHGGVITNGAITGRCTHSRPNLGQVPSIRSYKGEECRQLFYAPEGFKMVGTDAAGLELRMFAHYLAPFDSGRYGSIVTEGDVHTSNQQAAELTERDDAKTFIYAYLYGAGDAKLGSIAEPKASESRQREVGAELRRKFLTRTKGLADLIGQVQNIFRTRRYLVGLDGRLLYPRSAHSALNTLLQGAGAVVMKESTVLAAEQLRAKCIPYQPALHVHDEMQMIVADEYAEEAGQICVEAIRESGITLNVKCPLDAEAKIGKTWAETH